MLVAQLSGARIEAARAERGAPFACPDCAAPVILKAGAVVVSHFAHRPDSSSLCGWGRAETAAHLAAKAAFTNGFRARGWQTEPEYRLPELGRRADVLLTGPSGRRYAVEIQHSAIDPAELSERSRSYMTAGIVPLWVALMPTELIGLCAAPQILERYTAPPWQRWVHGFTFGQLPIFDTETGLLWDGKLRPVSLWVPETGWGGGYARASKRWRHLILSNPRPVDQVGVRPRHRAERLTARYWWPAGTIATFTKLPAPALVPSHP